MATMRTHDDTNSAGLMPGERPVPRISIHAFCEYPDTGAALQQASTDRRLSKARLGVQLGGIPAAIAYYSEQVTPNLLIVETKLSGADALAELDRLAQVCDPLTKVVIVGRTNDVRFYRDLMHRGASEYVVAPVEPMHLIEVISDLYATPDAKPVGRMIAFAGARGGAGSSTLAHNVAWCIANELRIQTMVVDFDLPFGTVGLDFNNDPGQGVQDALQAPERLDDVLLERLLAKQGEHLSLFTAPVTLDRDLDSHPEAYEAVLDAARRAVSCIVVDVPHTWDRITRSLLVGADEVVLVATPDLAALRNAKNLVEAVRLARPNDEPPKVVLNQMGVPKRPEILVKDFTDTIGYAPLLTVDFDPATFGLAANNGQMLAELGTKAPAVEAIRALAMHLTGRKPAEHKPATGSLFSTLFGKITS